MRRGRGARRGEGALQHTVTYANAWVLSVDGARRRIPGWAALAAGFAVVALAMLGGARLYAALPAPAPGGGEGAIAFDRLTLYACFLAPFYVAALALGRLYEVRTPRAPAPAAPAAGAAGAILGIGGFLVAIGLALALGVARAGPQGPTPGALDHRLEGAALGAVLILFQAGGEEVFFRGWLQPVLAARWGPWIGLAVTSLAFAAAHALARPLGPVAWINDTLAGAAFGLLALRTGGLAAPVAAHWGWNWTEQALAGATPNPGVDPLGSLFDLDLGGPSWLAGGADEMNGSLLGSVALLAVIACAAAWRPRAKV